MKLVFEKKSKGCCIIPECDVPIVMLKKQRKSPPLLPCLSENDISRHYTELSKHTYGINDGFYPLGSCTMKYNPKINETAASLIGFTKIHPMQDEDTIQGCLEAMKITEKYLCEITGMDSATFQAAAGAHGEFLGLLLIKAYFLDKGETLRNKIIVPDSAHGTNPASAAMAGFEIISVPSDQNGMVDIEKLKEVVGNDTSGLMLTNPNTVGIFDKNILEITTIIHDAGGLCYYDGANLNAIMGIVKPGDMGFDVMHINLHKTFSTPHGGGGPGSGPVLCKNVLKKYLPYHIEQKDDGYKIISERLSIGRIKKYYGNFLVIIKALTYLLTLGKEGITETSSHAVLNANYMMKQLCDTYDIAYNSKCMHEFVISLEKLKKETGTSAMDIAKGLLDYNIHPPTMYFPLIVHEALMIEPTETESKATIDNAVTVLKKLKEIAISGNEELSRMPQKTYIKRPDEVSAARNLNVKYQFKEEL